MKRILLKHLLKGITYGRFSFLIVCLSLSAGLSGQKVQTSLAETWVLGNWQNLSLVTNSYDMNGYLTSSLSQSWDDISGSWKNVGRSVYTNNPNGTASQMVSQLWEEITSEWINLQRFTYTYNGAGKILTTVSEMWMGTSWMNSTRHTNTYDGSGYLVNELNETWNLISSAWQNLSQSSFTNNPNGTPNQEVSQHWETGSGTWVNIERSTYTYNGSGKILTILYESWATTTWQNLSTDTYTYDVSGYLTNNLSRTWVSLSSSYVNDNQSNYTNNNDGSIHQVVNQVWDIGMSQWLNSDRITFTYLVTTALEKVIGEDSFCVIYPNPAHDAITLKFGRNTIRDVSFTLTDNTGRKVLTGKISEETTSVDISRLPNGIYFLRLGAETLHSYKVIKK
jgi:hypothetical protein